MLWDTAGQEEFDAITKAYYRGEKGVASPPRCGGCTEISLLWFQKKVYQLFSHIPGAQACVLVFSTTDRESFQAIDSWREKVEAEVGDVPTVLVQNKIDLLEETVIKKCVSVQKSIMAEKNGLLKK